jgi:hypothetical protein
MQEVDLEAVMVVVQEDRTQETLLLHPLELVVLFVLFGVR